MLTGQVYQQHRLVVMYLNKAKSFLAATVPSKVGTPPPRETWLMRMLHPTYRKNEGKNMGRHLELRERWRGFSREKRRGKREVRKVTHMKHKVDKARYRLTSSHSARSMFIQQRSAALTVSTTSTPC